MQRKSTKKKHEKVDREKEQVCSHECSIGQLYTVGGVGLPLWALNASSLRWAWLVSLERQDPCWGAWLLDSRSWTSFFNQAEDTEHTYPGLIYSKWPCLDNSFVNMPLFHTNSSIGAFCHCRASCPSNVYMNIFTLFYISPTVGFPNQRQAAPFPWLNHLHPNPETPGMHAVWMSKNCSFWWALGQLQDSGALGLLGDEAKAICCASEAKGMSVLLTCLLSTCILNIHYLECLGPKELQIPDCLMFWNNCPDFIAGASCIRGLKVCSVPKLAKFWVPY